jgi:alpha-tubulin suppressor-like RCC1 family protein
MTNRTSSEALPGVWAQNAQTNISNPAVGTSYRNANVSQAVIENGQPFANKVDFTIINQVLNVSTALLKQLEAQGILSWYSGQTYQIGALVLGSNGSLYKSKLNSNLNYDPVADVYNTWWVLVTPNVSDDGTLVDNSHADITTEYAVKTYVDNQIASIISGTTRKTGIKRFQEYVQGRCSCAPESNGFAYIDCYDKVRMWGANSYYRIPNVGESVAPGDTLSLPADTPTSEIPTKVYVNSYAVSVLTNAGNVYSSGYNGYGQFSLEDTTYEGSSQDLRKSTLRNIVKIATSIASVGHAIYYLDSNGDLWSAGYNPHGQLGNGTTANTNATGATRVLQRNVGTLAGGLYVTDICCSGVNANTALALISNGTVRTVGYNGQGQLGIGTNVSQSTWQTPTIPGVVTEIQSIGYSYGAFIVKTADNNLYGWGYNAYSVLSTGDTLDKWSPTLITTDVNKYWLQGYQGHLFVIKNTGNTVWGCGYQNRGQLGLGDTTTRNTLTQINSLDGSKIIEFVSGANYGDVTSILCVTTDGIYSAGYNGNHSLGSGVNGSTNNSTWTKCCTDLGTSTKPLLGTVSNTNPVVFLNHWSAVASWSFLIDSFGDVYGSGQSRYMSMALNPGTEYSNFTKCSQYS